MKGIRCSIRLPCCYVLKEKKSKQQLAPSTSYFALACDRSPTTSLSKSSSPLSKAKEYSLRANKRHKAETRNTSILSLTTKSNTCLSDLNFIAESSKTDSIANKMKYIWQTTKKKTQIVTKNTTPHNELTQFLFPSMFPLLLYIQPNNKGYAALKALKYEEALNYYERINNLESIIGFTTALLLANETEKAHTKLLLASQNYSKSFVLSFNCSVCGFITKQYPSVVEWVSKALTLCDVSDVWINYLYRLRAISYFQLKKFTLAAKDYLQWEYSKAVKISESERKGVLEGIYLPILNQAVEKSLYTTYETYKSRNNSKDGKKASKTLYKHLFNSTRPLTSNNSVKHLLLKNITKKVKPPITFRRVLVSNSLEPVNKVHDVSKCEVNMMEDIKKVDSLISNVEESHGDIKALDLVKKKKKVINPRTTITALDKLRMKIVKMTKMNKTPQKKQTVIENKDLTLLYNLLSKVFIDETSLIDEDLLEQIGKELYKIPLMRYFDSNTRKEIIKQSNVWKLKKTQKVYSQGEIGDSIYIILRGTVESYITDTLFGSEPVLVKIMHEGEHFGKIHIPSASNSLGRAVRSETHISASECCLLELPINYISEKLREKICNSDIKFLKETQYFSELTDFDLLQLLDNIHKLQYKYGEYILREGEKVEGMYIIIKGQCSFGIKVTEKRSLKEVKDINRTLEEMSISLKSNETSNLSLCSIKKISNESITYNNVV